MALSVKLGKVHFGCISNRYLILSGLQYNGKHNPEGHSCLAKRNASSLRPAASKLPKDFKLPRPPPVKTEFAIEPRYKLSFREEKISQAMKAYLQRRDKYEKFMEEELREFALGKRHLANIMGEDPAHFSQNQIDEAVAYLMPSGLFDPYARPLFKNPKDIIPESKVASFGRDGRPFHHLFYTSKPKFYTAMFDAGVLLDRIKHLANQSIMTQTPPRPKDRMSTIGDWHTYDQASVMFKERISPADYQRLVAVLSRLLYHPFSNEANDLVTRFRIVRDGTTVNKALVPPLLDESGVQCQVGEGRRKMSNAKVVLYSKGSGQVTINETPFTKYFPCLYDREHIAAPLLFTNSECTFDIKALVEGGGSSGQAGAIRLGIARALSSFMSADEIERMRLAGLLSVDPRRRERKKPGKHKARKSFTWKRR